MGGPLLPSIKRGRHNFYNALLSKRPLWPTHQAVGKKFWRCKSHWFYKSTGPNVSVVGILGHLKKTSPGPNGPKAKGRTSRWHLGQVRYSSNVYSETGKLPPHIVENHWDLHPIDVYKIAVTPTWGKRCTYYVALASLFFLMFQWSIFPSSSFSATGLNS